MTRAIGVALSGGGAWGFAHCALLRGLAERGIRVDVVAGASFGAVVGAFYAARGLTGLDLLVEQAPRLAGVLRWCPLSTAPIERFVHELIGDRLLDDLDVTFLPIAVDLAAAKPAVATRSLATAVRAACAFPGLWAPVVRDGVRYVDGCMASNVPVGALIDAGTELTIASCVMRPPSPRVPRPQRWWAPLSPAGRLDDFRRAIRLMAFTASRREAAEADLCFAPALSPFRITDFAAAPQIIERASGQLAPLLDMIAARMAANAA